MVIERDLHVPHLKYIMTNAEPLPLWQRRDIEHAFGCPVRENYGMAEAMVGASECEHGTLHLWPDAGVVELLHDDGSITNSGSGEVLGTTLHNRAMPLIRYRTGDRIDGLDPHASCACGRTLPVIRAIDGRRDDVIITPDGRRLGRMDPIFKDSLPIRKAQIVQVSRLELEVRLVPAEGYVSADGDTLAHRISQLVGDMNISIVLCTNIPNESNGKFKGVVNLLRA